MKQDYMTKGYGFSMNIEQYNLDSLRKLIRDLQKENTVLKAQLEKAGFSYDVTDVFAEKITDNEEYDLDQGSRIASRYIDDDLANRFFSMFWGRQDVYAKRAKTEITIRSVITDGLISVQNIAGKRSGAMNVKTQSIQP